MHLIDTHSHIYQEDFDEDIETVVNNAREYGITKICLPNVDLETVGRMHRLCDRYPETCYPMMGLHPTSIQASSYLNDLKIINSYFDKRKYIAVGEIGIDLYWDKTYLKEQIHSFEEQLRWSIDLQLPVVIHNRDAFPYVMESLHKIGIDKLKGIFHSFGGSREELDAILACENFLIGINGVITFKKSDFRDYLNVAPLERVVVETDAPYLSPVPFRGKRNEPQYIRYVVEQLANVYGVSVETIATQTSENASLLFGI